MQDYFIHKRIQGDIVIRDDQMCFMVVLNIV
jgi:hypothetical protein